MKKPYEVAQILFPALLAFSLLASLTVPGQVTFEDVTESVGLSGLEDQMACWGDFNNDGYVDLHCGATLWRNDGGTGFTGLTSGTERGSGGPSVWGDYDNDGDLDIFDYDQRQLYRNESGKGFTRIPLPELPAGAGLGGCWADYNGDGQGDACQCTGKSSRYMQYLIRAGICPSRTATRPLPAYNQARRRR